MTDPTINHADEALDWFDQATDQYEVPSGRVNHDGVMRHLAAAQVHATLALAHEAHTSALIARWDALHKPPVGTHITADQWTELGRLDDLIAARLDLTQDVTP